jgi:hypothetical protein
MLQPSFGSCYPMPSCPLRIMANMRLMSTFEVGNPVEAFILMKTHNFARDSAEDSRSHGFHVQFKWAAPSPTGGMVEAARALRRTVFRYALVLCESSSGLISFDLNCKKSIRLGHPRFSQPNNRHHNSSADTAPTDAGQNRRHVQPGPCSSRHCRGRSTGCQHA